MGEAADDLHDLLLRQSRQNHGASTVSKFVPKPGTFTLFDNRQSKTSDRAPDLKGDLTWLDGTVLELAIWVPSGDNGNRYSGTIKRKESSPPPPPPPAAEPSEDCPF